MNFLKFTSILLTAALLTACGQDSGSERRGYRHDNDENASSDEISSGNSESGTVSASVPAEIQTEPETAPADEGFTVNVSTSKKYDTYSCDGGVYFYTFDSECPQFEYSDTKHTEQQKKLNDYFTGVQDSMDNSKQGGSFQLVDRSTVESILETDYMKNTSTTQTYSVVEMNDKYCTVVMSNYSYGGGAHGYGWTTGYFIDLRSGNVLSLSDLFTSADEFRSYAGNYIYYEYYSQYSGLQAWNIETLTNSIGAEAGANWYIDEKALYIEYPAYTLDCYAAGSQLVSIPLDVCSYYWTDLSKDLFSDIQPKGKIEYDNNAAVPDSGNNNNVNNSGTPLFTGIVNTQKDPLNVRSQPSTNASVIGKLEKGSAVEVYSEADGWCEIRYNGQVGYVSKEFIICETGGFAKPVIYLYPEEKTDISVKVRFSNGRFTCTYPEYSDGWNVTAYPDGKLINKADNDEYSYLYWEGEGEIEYDFSSGFVVKSEDTADFLKEKLSYLGLTPKEYNEFIVYWLPIMQKNEYNLISFQTDNYDRAAKLEVTPEPDSMLRVFMAFKGVDGDTTVPQQKLERFERKGFSVIEWGGTEIK